MRRSVRAPGLLSAAALVLVGCGVATPRDSDSDPAAALRERAAEATYDGIWDDGPVSLSGGTYEDVAARRRLMLHDSVAATGDLDGDGVDDLTVLLSESSGGSGSYRYVAVLTARDDASAPVNTTRVGDRVKLRDLRVEDDRVVLDVLQAGAEDAMCCPGELASRVFVWDGTSRRLVEQPSDVPTARLSLAAVTGEWTLVAWDFDEPAESDPAVTLRIEEGGDGRIGGLAGCNTYSGAATEGGDVPGSIAVGPLATTKKRCPEPAMSVERRYLGALQGTTGFGFHLGRLALTTRSKDGVRTLLFEH